MTAVVSWYLVAQLLGCIAYLLTTRYCRALPDAGYASSKCLGVFLCGFLLWIGTSLGVLRNGPMGAALIVLLLAVTAALQTFRNRGSRGAAAPPAHVVIATEALFITVFAAWCCVRFATPAVNHTEQPMDLMMLTAVAGSPGFPPADPWLAGYPISYYYVGYWIMSAVGHLTAQPPAVSYNVGQACGFALLVATVFGVGYNIVAADPRCAASRRAAIGGGVLAALAVAFCGNLLFPLEAAGAWVRGRPAPWTAAEWWWWPSSRVVHDVGLTGGSIEIITEFPFFSYLLGDNHPHLLAMPFLALAISLALGLYLTGVSSSNAEAERRRSQRILESLLIGICAASIGLNTWDFPAVLLLFTGALLLRPADPSMQRTLSAILRTLLIALLVIVAVNVPYFLTAQSQLQGILPNLFHPTRLSEFAVVFGTLGPGVVLLLLVARGTNPPAAANLAKAFLAGVLASAVWLLAGAFRATKTADGSAWLGRVAGNIEHPLSMSLQRWMIGWPVLVILLLGCATAVSFLWLHARDPRNRSHPVTFALLLASVGFLLALVPELAYVHDVFANRMNTVFKFYYQAWLFFGIAAAVGTVSAWRRGGYMRAAAGVALALVVCGLPYAPAALASRPGESSGGTFDGLDFVSRERPDVHAALEWIRSHTRIDDRIAEAAGSSYDVATSTVSMATGRPTLLGWEGHERQWRGPSFDQMAGGRADALRRIYAPRSEREIQQALSDWDVAFVYLGPVERAKYRITPEYSSRINSAMDLVFEQGTVRIYKRRAPGENP